MGVVGIKIQNRCLAVLLVDWKKAHNILLIFKAYAIILYVYNEALRLCCLNVFSNTRETRAAVRKKWPTYESIPEENYLA